MTTGLCSSRRAFTRPRSTASRHRKFIVDSQTPNPIVVHTAMADYLQFSLRRAHALQVTREISNLAHFLCSACTCTSESFRFITHMLETVQQGVLLLELLFNSCLSCTVMLPVSLEAGYFPEVEEKLKYFPYITTKSAKPKL